MRHHNPIVNYYNNLRCKRPYDTRYIDSYNKTEFKKTANSKRRYVQIIQYVADHDGCKRIDILRDVFGYKNVNKKDSWYKNMRACRGYGSSIFSQLLYIDVIDYDKNFNYHITDRGREVLKAAYLNDCAKIAKGK